MITFLQNNNILTCLGINLVGAGKPEVFFIWIGKGRNGKGVIWGFGNAHIWKVF